MGIVPTRVHPAVDAGPEGQVDLFGHRKGIDVGAQQHPSAIAPAVEAEEGAGLRRTWLFCQAKGRQAAADEVGGCPLFETQLWLGVQPAPRVDGAVEGRVGKGGQVALGEAWLRRYW
jgi:hypothetical protein